MNARQFFDVWPQVVECAAMVRRSPGTQEVWRYNLLARINTRHGPAVEREAAVHLARLLASAQEPDPR